MITSVYKMYFINYWFIDFAEIYHEAFGSFRFFFCSEFRKRFECNLLNLKNAMRQCTFG